MIRALALLALTLGGELCAQQVTAADLDQILEKADKILEEAKASYEAAATRSSVESFVEAGFKLEEARIKYIVIQEIGGAEKQKIAADRLRAVNQLSKLIHDGKVAISGTAAEAPRPADPAPSTDPAAKPVVPQIRTAANVTARAAIPDAEKQKEADKQLKELFKDLYAKKTVADRKLLLKALLEQAAKSQEDLTALWVLYREAQDTAALNADVVTAVAVVEAAARVYDIDSLQMKSTAISSSAKAAKAPEEFALLAEALLKLIDDLVAADQFDPADKAAAVALQHARKSAEPAVLARATTRVREITEAKSLYQGMKKNLETLAKNPEDPSANFELGKFMCFVKGSWDLGLRFLAKGSDATLKGLADKELALSAQPGERLAVADGWWELSEKEKSPLRKGQMQIHCRGLYEASLADAPVLVKARIEKRLESLRDPATAAPGSRPARKITLTKVKFSAGNKTFDLTKDVQAAYDKNSYMPIRCDDYLVMGENTMGQGKSMSIEGSIDGKTIKENVKDGEVFIYPRIPSDGVTDPKASQKFAIVEAWFGVGTSFGDCTEALRAKLTDVYQPFANSIINQDPFPGKVKTMVVIFEFRGKRYVRWLSDGDTIPLLRK